ncbi:RidA family protein [Hydrogenophaga sp. BPS33]|uniref:RidA family protein n=1 Tax=Hydrogenophaga sp. BPS33 TaxID=2651974 RepID=UPI001F1B05E4|nr:RidA family protein [Hydrogenophaga sp. BPS33]
MSMRRPRSLDVEGLGHGSAPIPMGARVGNMIFTSGIAGKDPRTGKLAEGATAQAFHAFENLRQLLENGGATMADVGQVTVLTVDESLRDAVNAEWLRHFPDPHDRPARHTTVQALRGGALLQLMAIAAVPDNG